MYGAADVGKSTTFARLAESLSSEEAMEARALLKQLKFEIVAKQRNVHVPAILVVSSKLTSTNLEEAVEACQSGSVRVVGVECLRQSLDQRVVLVDRQVPVLHYFLRGKTVCFSGISTIIKAKLSTLVQAMGGLISPGLSLTVTHLVTTALKSDKCQVAIRQNQEGSAEINIVSPKWVEDCWEKSAALDEIAFCIRAPIFEGERMSCTLFPPDERTRISKLAKEYGAEFVCDLDSKCTRLIAMSAESPKYEYAVKRGISVVSLMWLQDSCRRATRLPDFRKLEYLVSAKACSSARSDVHQAIATYSTPPLQISADNTDSRDGFAAYVPKHAIEQSKDQCGRIDLLQNTNSRNAESTIFDRLKFFLTAELSTKDCRDLSIMCRLVFACSSLLSRLLVSATIHVMRMLSRDDVEI